MDENPRLSNRVNLILPLEVSIEIEKEAEKRGINRTQYIKEAIHEKIRRIDTKDIQEEILNLKSDMKELKYLTLSILDKINNT
jgi:hypothetical protein